MATSSGGSEHQRKLPTRLHRLRPGSSGASSEPNCDDRGAPRAYVIERRERIAEEVKPVAPPALVERRITRERRTEDHTVIEERFVSPASR